jgi:anti-anti-sigma regulatory factor
MRTVAVNERTLTVEVGGHASNALLQALAQALDGWLADQDVESLIVDARGVTGIDGDVRHGGVAVLTTLRSRGEPFVVVVNSVAAIRMVAENVAFAARYPVFFAETLEKAQTLVLDHRRRHPTR